MPPLTGKDMTRLLKKNGWVKIRQNGSHQQFYKDGTTIPVPVHGNKDLPKGTEQKILKKAGLQ